MKETQDEKIRQENEVKPEAADPQCNRGGSSVSAAEKKPAGESSAGQPEKTPSVNDVQQDDSAAEKEEKKEKDKIRDAEEKIALLEKDNAELKDQLLRRAADFDNYRKRMLKEKEETYEYANTNLLQDLLESLDDFNRTADAASTAKDVKSIADGVKMVNNKLVTMLESKYNLVAYGTAGDSFNPDEHQAIGSVQGPVAEPVLKEVYLRGYKLKDRVIRHAKVMVMMPSEAPADVKTDSTDSKNDAAVTDKDSVAEPRK